MANLYVHDFEAGVDDPSILGGKGSSLARMTQMGLPIPPGFTIGTAGWELWRGGGGDGGIPADIASELAEGVAALEAKMGRKLDDRKAPLLVSVRSGAPVSMPGMMDTILNLGLSRGMIGAIGDPDAADFAWDNYTRLLRSYGSIVRGLSDADLDAVEDGTEPGDARASALEAAIEARGAQVPQGSRAQLDDAIQAVWRSWNSERAQRYRKFAGISDDLGTAVTVQAMVFGNYDERSGTGVVFTRDPATGSPGVYGDFLAMAQGEEVVAGGHDPEPIESARAQVPEAYEELERALAILEAGYRDMCDVEFTVEQGRLWILQARVGQRSGAAAVRIAVDMVDEGLIAVEDALQRIPLHALEDLQKPVLARGQEVDLLGTGTPASPGAAVGEVCFTSAEAEKRADAGASVVLVRPETSPNDIGGMLASRGIVTALGGRASHAAVVARGIGRPAVCGVAGLRVDDARAVAEINGRVLSEGDVVSVDGSTGTVAAGALKLAPAQPDPRLARLLDWCEERRTVDIVTEAPEGFAAVSSPEDVAGRAGHDRLLIEVAGEGNDAKRLLERTIDAVMELPEPPEELGLALPAQLKGADLRPPDGPWKVIVVSSEGDWAARLLGGRLGRVPAKKAASTTTERGDDSE